MVKANSRKRYLISSSFQLRYTFFIIALLLTVMVVTGMAFYIGMVGSAIESFSGYRVSKELESANDLVSREGGQYAKQNYDFLKMFREAMLLSGRQKQMIYDAMKDINKKLIPKLLLLSVAIIIFGILISHRVAGPMYRIEQSAEAIRRGNLRVNFSIRKSDEMKKVSAALNDMTKSLHKDMEDAKKAAAALEVKAGLLTGRLPDGELKDIRTLAGEISAVLSKYKL